LEGDMALELRQLNATWVIFEDRKAELMLEIPISLCGRFHFCIERLEFTNCWVFTGYKLKVVNKPEKALLGGLSALFWL